MKKNTYLHLNLLAAAFIFLFGCTKNANDAGMTDDGRITAAGSIDNHVVITSSSFSPVRAQVVVGTTITWINQDNAVHTVSSFDDSFDSGDIKPGGTFSYTPPDPGTRGYRCKYHDKQVGELVAGMIK